MAAGIYAALILYQKGFTPDGFGMLARYASGYYPGLVVLAALGVDEAVERGPALRIGALGVLGLALTASLAVHSRRNLWKAPAAFGIEDRDAYLEQRINSYWAIRRAEGELSPGRKILLIEPRAYYCRAPYWVGSDSSMQHRNYDFSGGPELRDFLSKHSFQFIVFNHAGHVQAWKFRNLLSRQPSVLRDAGVETVETRTECTLYRIP
jgi:hypothetical protein